MKTFSNIKQTYIGPYENWYYKKCDNGHYGCKNCHHAVWYVAINILGEILPLSSV